MVEIPEIIKGTAQINFIEDATINVMNLETYESIDVEWPKEENLISKLKDLQKDPSQMSSAQVELWELAGKSLINRVIIN